MKKSVIGVSVLATLGVAGFWLANDPEQASSLGAARHLPDTHRAEHGPSAASDGMGRVDSHKSEKELRQAFYEQRAQQDERSKLARSAAQETQRLKRLREEAEEILAKAQTAGTWNEEMAMQLHTVQEELDEDAKRETLGRLARLLRSGSVQVEVDEPMGVPSL